MAREDHIRPLRRTEYDRLVEAGVFQDDRETKARIYATMGVPEYWIVNLVDNLVERHTEPQAKRSLLDSDGHYLRVEPAGADAALKLIAFPDVELRARDFLPL